jgi:hypothetical protein
MKRLSLVSARTAVLSLICLVPCAFAMADVIPADQPPACHSISISDDKEIQKLMELIPGKGKVETRKGPSDDSVEVTTKELSLGPDTTITCRSITQGGKMVGYFYGQRPSCKIDQVPSRRAAPGAAAPAGATR